MYKILQLTGVDDCFVFVDADHIYAITEEDEHIEKRDGKEIKVLPFTCVMTVHNANFRVKDRPLDIIKKIEELNQEEDL